MHIPKKFKRDNTEQLIKIIQSYPFATLVMQSDLGLEIKHLPILLKQIDDKFFLNGHIAKADTVWESVQDRSEVVVIFNGPNCYISPNHYPSKIEHGKVVPTWNYVVVHVKGLVSFIHDTDWVHNHIDQLSNEHESESARPWAVSDAPEEYIAKMLPAVVGIDIEVSSIIGQWKLSQNQAKMNQQGVMQGLSSLSDPASQEISSMMLAQGESAG